MIFFAPKKKYLRVWIFTRIKRFTKSPNTAENRFRKSHPISATDEFDLHIGEVNSLVNPT